MARPAAEPLRRAEIVRATIQEIGQTGTLEVTVAQIARRAGVSSALAHHYFGSKEAIFLAAMRHILGIYGAEVRGALATVEGPEARIEAIVRVSFSQMNFRREVIAAWMNFYVLAQTMDGAHRLLEIYRRRLRSNLVVNLRPLVGENAGRIADSLGALIDGVYLRAALGRTAPDRAAAAALVMGHLEAELARGRLKGQ
ncbi:choline-binding transcriptional repressor BetI [Frigidibacter sp. MR17.24]|uniref:choline-binding transcriptional repressor BetI n=1 Tax=Frigidibacter sp. MR17.24 TaxID=3127345 RepID=UPI003012B3D2